MKKIIIAAAAILLLVVGYNMWGGGSPDSTIDSSGDSSSFGSTFKKSISNILPGGSSQDDQANSFENNPHVVVIKSKPVHIEVEDAIERIESQKDLKDNEALEFARWTLTSDKAKYTSEEREGILEGAIDALRPQEKTLLLRDVIFQGKEKNQHEIAISNLGQSMDKDALESFVREVVTRNPPGKPAVIEYAATRNIYVK